MEQWRVIEGFEKYQISSIGRVKSFQLGKEQILKPVLVHNGYLHIALSNGIEKKQVCVHRLVAQAFIPNPDNKPQVNHINGDKTDNRVENLEWVTASENRKHAYSTGLQKCGEGIYNAKLTNEQVLYIRNNPDNLNVKRLAEKFGVGNYIISMVQLGKNYRSVGGKIRIEKLTNGIKSIPEDIKSKILAEYKPRTHGRGSHALAKKYGISQTTVLRIVKKRGD